MRRLLEGSVSRASFSSPHQTSTQISCYKDGLQRSQFLPAIELIKRNLSISGGRPAATITGCASSSAPAFITSAQCGHAARSGIHEDRASP